ncbi:hypothetical protein [Antarcticibacterium sp. W02-3]|uniref:hypothetical protein n=1 Tax=Antarcticibacterium sp. W02-3 TaxID=2183747 RepID=UPI002042D179|nr:hypothetical protein [Antarcticibacterium sp. W02-3]
MGSQDAGARIEENKKIFVHSWLLKKEPRIKNQETRNKRRNRNQETRNKKKEKREQ